ILIDEARTPLIISGRLEQSAEAYKTMAKLAPKLKKELDYTVEEKNKNVILTEEGIDRAQEVLGIEDLFDASNQFAHHLLQALKAKELFKRDTDYVVKDNEIVIVDEFTGRLMQGRRWSDGLHQAIEAKEGVKIQDETQTLASITFQNLFRLYPKLSGMTGTAMTEEAEFGKIYGLEVTQIPTNKIDQRKDMTDVVYKTEKQKYLSVVDEIIEQNKKGRPVLVGTISIDKSELLSSLLKKRSLNHNVLNAKHHEREAQIIAQAGRKGAVTIATNMAGRGTDILLGGNPEFLAKDILTQKGIKPDDKNYKEERQKALEEALEITKQEHEDVVKAGGLHVIGTERHESRRIDNQLRGRAARQGDPGSTRFFLSLEDNLMRIFGGDKVAAIMNTLIIEEDMAIESPLITRQIQSAQKKVETYHFDTRKHVLEYDDVMNQQRERFYAQRRRVLEGKDLREEILYMIDCEITRILYTYLSPEMVPFDYDQESLDGLVGSIHSTIPQLGKLSVDDIKDLPFMEIQERLQLLAKKAYEEHEQRINDSYEKLSDEDESVVRLIEKDILLRVVDNKWIDHLHNIDMLREGIGLRAYGQKDPLIEYKREAFNLFNAMMFDIQKEVVSYLFRAKVHIEILGEQETKLSKAMEQFVTSAKSEDEKIGRNDPCPCGSGKKYKKCCGK
ncbi:MAG: preprotein translocase subunit SecA, partial [Candidatus Gastranaerophilales bacterium]|nr:preprotein translocase subunit SecA [Candidatus Gastranaerophilales bacterium]